MRFAFLKKNQNKYNILKACKILKISRSGYYGYLHRKKSKRVLENEALTEIIKEVFNEHKGRYGARRIKVVLGNRQIKLSVKRISRLMSEAGLKAKGARKSYRYQPNKSTYDEKENILDQVFSASKKNTVWVGDITYIHTKHGFLYLSAFIDIYSRKVVGWSMNTRIKDDLAIAALYQAVQREQPNKNLIIHTDRGAQYTSKRFMTLLDHFNFQQSMSRKGNPYDNAVMESFYRTLKRELVQGATYDNPEQAKLEIFKYIETYYNTKRIHSALGYLSPTAFEAKSS